jgi:hypothetical protein
MSKANFKNPMRRMGAGIVLIVLLTAAVGAWPRAGAVEDPAAFCRRMLTAGWARAVAIAVTSPGDFYSYYYSAFAGYEWCMKYIV